MATYWSEDTLHPVLTQQFKNDGTILSKTSKYQHIEIFENPIFGRVLALDGIIQTTERDEFIYHETFAHVPMIEHSDPRKVLVVGGGDGGLCEEILKHPNVEIVQVEIDEDVVAVSKEHLPTICGDAFDTPRNRLIIDDALRFIGSTTDLFDLIFVDSTDPKEICDGLFSQEFFERCTDRLTPGGAVVTQLGCPFVQRSEFVLAYQALTNCLPNTSLIHASVPSYNGGPIVFAHGSLRNHRLGSHSKSYYERAYRGLSGQLGYLDYDVHMSSLALPKNIRRYISVQPSAE